jgi:Predicted metal binding domain
LTGAQAKAAVVHPAAARQQFEQEVAAVPPRLFESRGWTLHNATYPLVDISFTAPGRKTLRLHLMCDDWNDRPPSVALCEPDGRALARVPTDPRSVINAGPHPATGRPFICVRGSREYHTHPSHCNDLWNPLRTSSDYTLFNIIGQVWNAWLKTTDVP